MFSSNIRVDAVFSDINLQGELTGHALARWLEKHFPTVPILLTSGDKAAAARVVSERSTQSFIVKPYSLLDVDQRLKAILPRHG